MTYHSILSTRVEELAIILSWANKFFDEIKNIVLRMDPPTHNQFVDMARAADAAITELKSLELSSKLIDNLVTGIRLFDLLNQINEFIDLAQYLCLHEEYNRQLMLSLSSTLSATVQAGRKMLLQEIDKLKIKSIEEDIALIDELLAGLDKNVSAAVSFITEHPSATNKFFIELLRRSIRIVGARGGGATLQMLKDIVETQKNSALGIEGRVDLSKYAAPQNPLVRYGLCPKTSFMPLEEIIALIGAKVRGKPVKPHHIIAPSEPVEPPIIIISKISPSPLEFDMRGLIMPDYIAEHDLQTNEQSGLTKKVLERFTTIKTLPGPATDARAGVTWVGEMAAQVCILETFNGQSYRVLTTDGALLTNYASVRGLVEGLSARPMRYAALQEEEILARCFDSKAKAILMDYENEKRSMPSSAVLKEQIGRDLAELYERRLVEMAPDSLAAFKQVVLDCEPEITAIIMDRMTAQLKATGIGREEYIVTYITKFDTIVREFMKAMEAKFKQQKLSALFFKEKSKDDVTSDLSAICRDIATGAINELDKNHKWSDYDISIKEYFLTRKFAVV